jgi:hypothetical protein
LLFINKFVIDFKNRSTAPPPGIPFRLHKLFNAQNVQISDVLVVERNGVQHWVSGQPVKKHSHLMAEVMRHLTCHIRFNF